MIAMAKKRRKTVGFPVKVVKEIQTLFRKHIGKKIILKEIRAMLRYLLDNYNDVSYKKGVLTIQTDDIYRGYNRGPHDIRLDFKRLGKRTSCHYDILTISPTSGGEPVHSSGCMCFGYGWEVCQKSVSDGRIDDFVDIVQAILRT